MVESINWVKAARITDIPPDCGVCIKIGNEQIAVFNYSRRNEYFAVQNQCPHKRQMVLSRGMIGDSGGEPKVACPFHKRTFSLNSGKCLNDDEYCIKTFPVKVENGEMFIGIGG